MDPLTFGMGVLGIGANLFGQSQTNKMQQQMMQQQQSFQERMSSTAYQRASADMQAAGLNPMMMFGSGGAASSPVGASPSPNVKSGLDADSMAKVVSTATQAKVAAATIDNLVEQNAKIKAETLTEKQRPLLVVTQQAREHASANKLDEETANVRATRPIIENAGITAKNEADINPTVRKIADQAGFGGKRVDQIMAPVTSIMSTAKGIKYLNAPSGRRSSHERREYDSDGDLSRRTFEDRFHY